MRRCIWIVGAPGSGKTTVVRGLLGPFSEWQHNPIPKWTFAGNVCAAGHYFGNPFDGADTIPLNGWRPAMEFWAEHLRLRYDVTLLDGDRLSHQACLDFVKANAVAAHAIVLRLPMDLAGERSAAHARQYGLPPQTEKWAKGRRTKAARFAELLPSTIIDVSPTASPNEVVEHVRSHIRLLA